MLLTEKERLLQVLSGKRCDRPPVIAPGGMMSPLTSALLEGHRIDGGEAMSEAGTMALAAELAREATGIENLGVPFCLTVEAEALGAVVSRGSTSVEPLIVQPAIASTSGISSLVTPEPQRDRRMSEVLKAINLLRSRYPQVPIIGNLSGPVTLAASILPCEVFLKLLIKNNEPARRVVRIASETITRFGAAMIENGADVILVGDPTGAGEIVGPHTFDKYLLPVYREIFSLFRVLGAKSILHICGNVKSILPHIESTGADAFSMDSMMSVRRTRQELGQMPVMGNTSTLLLAKGRPTAIVRAVRTVLSEGVDIMAPSCGLDRSSPLENLRLMCQTAKSWKQGEADERSSRRSILPVQHQG